jgi:ABC-type nitrate/sulfonate/bicarbonate transport system ATPase subunit
VLNGISFTATAGQIVGIFGPSGCGKTTLLRILCGVLSYEGDVLLFNRTAREQRGTVAYVPQRAELLYWRTLFSNALLGWSIKTHHLRKDPEVVTRARELFGRFRLGDAEQKYPRQSSGGERQRTALIRALLTPAQVLALDEPVGAIDHITRAEIYQTLLDLVVEDTQRKTVLMVSHDPEELLFLCDRVLVIPKVAAEAITDVVVPFARPRDPDLKFTSDFVALKRQLWSLLK